MHLLLCLGLFLSALATSTAFAGCPVRNTDGSAAAPKADLLYRALAEAEPCPRSVQDLKALLRGRGLNARPAMVANRGRKNPAEGSFSFFEVVVEKGPAPLFFGHFTGAQDGQVVLDQEPTPGKLMVELIAWDDAKGFYNFYELIGDGGAGRWFYRGDSADALADNSSLYLGEAAKFGNRMRCSACHSSGGPIMKELAAPHNDWWRSDRPLLFGPNSLSAEVAQILASALEAGHFAEHVKVGIDRLEASAGYQAVKAAGSRRAQMRPLFCETEINIESAEEADDALGASFRVPSASIVSPRLYRGELTAGVDDYRELLQELRMNFPETEEADADHPWLVPVKGYSDQLAIDSLIARGLIDEEFALDVLSVELERPLFSSERCELLKLVPEGPGWREEFLTRLRAAGSPAAEELTRNLSDPSRDGSWHRARAARVFAERRRLAGTFAGLELEFRRLLDSREAVFTSEISKNPRGQILEPGFRVIFPVSEQR